MQHDKGAPGINETKSDILTDSGRKLSLKSNATIRNPIGAKLTEMQPFEVDFSTRIGLLRPSKFLALKMRANFSPVSHELLLLLFDKHMAIEISQTQNLSFQCVELLFMCTYL